MQVADFVILGAGVTGLAAARELGDAAVVLERDERPGGLVKTECFDGYWFDRVIHLLHFNDPETERRIRTLFGSGLVRCCPEAYIETAHGVTRFPIQTNLNGLDPEVVVRCLSDFAAEAFGPQREDAGNFEELLLRSFGRSLCDVFLLPYNRKMWKRPLDSLATSDFTWNISRPGFEQVLRGALTSRPAIEAYNSNGWYPRPPHDSPVRGMEMLSVVMAEGLHDLRLQHTVEEIDLAARTVVSRHGDQTVRFQYREGCLSSLPLPVAVRLCRQAPDNLRTACGQLVRNRVRTVTFSIQGPRPTGRGLWRYYADESILFSRLIHMYEFDPLTAPADGWGMMAEVTERAEDPPMPDAELIRRVRADVLRVGAVPGECRIIDEHVILVDPAYVVFNRENRPTIEAARKFLLDHGVTPLGRYGRWEYSSMAQAIRDGFAWGQSAREAVFQRRGTKAA